MKDWGPVPVSTDEAIENALAVSRSSQNSLPLGSQGQEAEELQGALVGGMESQGPLNNVGKPLAQSSRGGHVPPALSFPRSPSLCKTRADEYLSLFHEREGTGGLSRRPALNKQRLTLVQWSVEAIETFLTQKGHHLVFFFFLFKYFLKEHVKNW